MMAPRTACTWANVLSLRHPFSPRLSGIIREAVGGRGPQTSWSTRLPRPSAASPPRRRVICRRRRPAGCRPWPWRNPPASRRRRPRAALQNRLLPPPLPRPRPRRWRVSGRQEARRRPTETTRLAFSSSSTGCPASGSLCCMGGGAGRCLARSIGSGLVRSRRLALNSLELVVVQVS